MARMQDEEVSAAGEDPVGEAVRKLRASSSSLKAFITVIAGCIHTNNSSKWWEKVNIDSAGKISGYFKSAKLKPMNRRLLIIT
jgi:hypothetical protein